MNDGWDDDLDNLSGAEPEKLGGDQPSGWEEDDDLFGDSDSIIAEATKPLSSDDGFLQGSTGEDGNGWGDDDDLFDDSESQQPVQGPTSNTADNVQQAHAQPDGWTDDFDFDDTEPAIEEPGNNDPLVRDIETYLDSLPHVVQSLRSLLQAEYSTPEQARELWEYYSSRPQLINYTCEKELPRMDYVVLEPQAPVRDKATIADIFRRIQNQPPYSILVRAANQSILADIVQILEGPDRVSRPQLGSTLVADRCQFVLDFSGQAASLHVTSRLQLSLPTLQGRWVIGHLPIHVQWDFQNGLADVKYLLEDYQPSGRDRDPDQLLACANCLRELDLPSHVEAPPRENARDAFLNMHGIMAAWHDIDKVTGLSQKIQKLPTLLPNVVEEPMSPPQQRPTSILGGFVRSGFTKLAKTVALPEEDDRMYQEWQSDRQGEISTAPKRTPPRVSGKTVSHSINRPQVAKGELPVLKTAATKGPEVSKPNASNAHVIPQSLQSLAQLGSRSHDSADLETAERDTTAILPPSLTSLAKSGVVHRTEEAVRETGRASLSTPVIPPVMNAEVNDGWDDDSLGDLDETQAEPVSPLKRTRWRNPMPGNRRLLGNYA